MDPTERFAELLAGPADQIALDELALLIAAHAYPGLDIAGELHRIDALAAGCDAPTLDALITHLFVDQGFAGNRQEYDDPRNSFLNDVLDRRTGIPITLAVLMVSVGRRLGVPLAGVGMPGHFLVRDKVDPELFIDPFAYGTRLDRAGCIEAFRSVHGPEVPFDPAYLEPVDAVAITGRMLANLRSVYVAAGRRADVVWVLRLRALVPGMPPEGRAELAALLAASGRFAEAGEEYDSLAVALGGELGAEYHGRAEHARARLN
jgi:regulator of sirC expression with transglutaminase-like and TPR domain